MKKIADFSKHYTHPFVYLGASIYLYLNIGIYGCLFLLTNIFFIYILKYKVIKNDNEKEKEAWLIRASANLSLIAIPSLLLLLTSF